MRLVAGPVCVLRHGDVVVMDDLPAREPSARLIGSVGARLLFLPPHPPGFNRIERAFAEIEAPVGKSAVRIVAEAWGAILQASCSGTGGGGSA